MVKPKILRGYYWDDLFREYDSDIWFFPRLWGTVGLASVGMVLLLTLPVLIPLAAFNVDKDLTWLEITIYGVIGVVLIFMAIGLAYLKPKEYRTHICNYVTYKSNQSPIYTEEQRCKHCGDMRRTNGLGRTVSDKELVILDALSKWRTT